MTIRQGPAEKERRRPQEGGANPPHTRLDRRRTQPTGFPTIRDRPGTSGLSPAQWTDKPRAQGRDQQTDAGLNCYSILQCAGA